MFNTAQEKILIPLIEEGYEAYIAGGSIRSLLFHEDPHDVDICTSAPEKVLRKLFPQLIDISKNMNLQVYSVKIGKHSYEIAHFRCNEKYSNGRTPDSVEFECSAKQDAARRDFTINSMFMTYDDEIIDFFGGKEDIQNRILRAVGNPEERFAEDYLRILRAVRFAAKYDLQIEENTRKAMMNKSKGLLKLPPERIVTEFEKMMSLGGREFSRALKIMRDTGILALILPEVAILDLFPHSPEHHPEGNALQHTLQAVRVAGFTTPTVLWATLFHDLGKAVTYVKRWKESAQEFRHTYHGHDKAGVSIIEEIGKRLKLSNEVIEAAKFCARWHMLAFKLQEMKTENMMKVASSPYFDILIEVSEADVNAREMASDWEALQQRKEFVKEFQKAAQASKVITGDLVMETCNIAPGPKVGKALEKTKAWFISQIVKRKKPEPTMEEIIVQIKGFYRSL